MRDNTNDGNEFSKEDINFLENFLDDESNTYSKEESLLDNNIDINMDKLLDDEEDKKGKPVSSLKEEPIKATKSKKALSTVMDVLFIILIVGIVAGSVFFALSKDTTKNYFGYRFYLVKTDSMDKGPGHPSGGFNKGSLIVVRMLKDPNSLKKGDIITFNPDPRNQTVYLTHRIYNIADVDEYGNQGIIITTKGDNNPSPDPARIDTGNVIGTKVFAIPEVGTIIQLVQYNWKVAILLAIGVIGFFTTWKLYLKDGTDGKESKKAKS